MLFDTHVHLNSDRYNEDLDTVINRALQTGVKKMLCIGYDIESSKKAIELSEKYEFIYSAIGIHPCDAHLASLSDLDFINENISHEKVVAIGEIGIDHYHSTEHNDIQDEFFKKQLAIAEEYGLPVVIHTRDSVEHTYDILVNFDVKGVLHCFSSSYEMAMKFIKNGFFISLGGPVTFKNAKQPKDVATRIPIDKLLVETDCPYLAPHPNRGKRNEPAYVKLVAEEIANLRNIPYEELIKKVYNNSLELFNIKER